MPCTECTAWFRFLSTRRGSLLSLLTMTAVGLNALFTWHFLGVSGLIGAAYAPVLAWAAALALAVVVVIRLVRKGQLGEGSGHKQTADE